ncbi:hypothetical protein [Paraburkholderia sp. SIMBA_027]|uniref:hypothetical protein n=1 Tax=Paraburkholderia sp. SIMBA_027 TaxID=3085770 RepID=UPI00397BF446
MSASLFWPLRLDVAGERETTLPGSSGGMNVSEVKRTERAGSTVLSYSHDGDFTRHAVEIFENGTYQSRLNEVVCFRRGTHDDMAKLHGYMLAEMEAVVHAPARSPQVRPLPDSAAREIRLAVQGIVITLSPKGGGAIRSSLNEEGEIPEAKSAIDAVESMILAHAAAGIDVEAPPYLEGVERAVEAIWNVVYP